MTHPHPYPPISLEEITTRNETARHLIAGFAAQMPTLAEFWRTIDTALTDILTLSAEIARLTAELTATLLDRANLLAAISATLAASADGEADPLWYVRDELSARQMPSHSRGRAS
jgi:hypothetical protein